MTIDAGTEQYPPASLSSQGACCSRTARRNRRLLVEDLLYFANLFARRALQLVLLSLFFEAAVARKTSDPFFGASFDLVCQTFDFIFVLDFRSSHRQCRWPTSDWNRSADYCYLRVALLLNLCRRRAFRLLRRLSQLLCRSLCRHGSLPVQWLWPHVSLRVQWLCPLV